MKRSLISLLCLAFCAGASPGDYVSSAGTTYRMSCNANGYVLRTPSEGARGTLYLGRSCDAFSRNLGEGKWCWANGGFIAEFSRGDIGFPRQEPRCPGQSTIVWPEGSKDFEHCHC